MAAFIAKQMVGNQLSAVKGTGTGSTWLISSFHHQSWIPVYRFDDGVVQHLLYSTSTNVPRAPRP
uniref:MIP20873p n=1 Tax=Drosophila melanogaster TaxID=7227 RepID=D5AEK0_DROME|nr:MIP20873p [Drosophila melanogaster]